jgi:hypothetical protein
LHFAVAIDGSRPMDSKHQGTYDGILRRDSSSESIAIS